MAQRIAIPEVNQIGPAVRAIDPLKYVKTRNFIDGYVTYLSPYISRGFLSNKKILKSIADRGYTLQNSEKFVQELVWRDFWQWSWQSKGDRIFRPLIDKQSSQQETETSLNDLTSNAYDSPLPTAILEARTGITAIDDAIKTLYKTGYMHNHHRMYVASVVCNIAKCDWLSGARWMHHYLLDGDFASNMLSWQWVAGESREKKYYANQENINKYARTNQTGTFLDVSYEQIDKIAIPTELQNKSNFKPREDLFTQPETKLVRPEDLEQLKEVGVLTPNHCKANWNVPSIFWLPPKYYKKFPISRKVLNFYLKLIQDQNVLGVFLGSAKDLRKLKTKLHYYQHPFFKDIEGEVHQMEQITTPGNDTYKSFFSYWKNHLNQINVFFGSK